ncbi:MAG TPA: DEAD/DEAH box helicase [Opitutaceae bacterium]|nr:DEAD/DEAH box helicase [Opitutaceae bacterium]
MPKSRDPASPEALAALAGYLDSFEARTKSRGREYFKSGRVISISAEGPWVSAIVRGTSDYGVDLNYEGDAWFSDCDCPVSIDCKHAYAAAQAWMRRHDDPRHKSTARQPVPAVTIGGMNIRPGEEPLVSAFMKATGRAPDRAQVAWMRNLETLHESLVDSGRHAWFDFEALRNLAPAAHRAPLRHNYKNPFPGWWTKPPATPIDLWPFVALYFTENGISLPDFAAPFARLEKARAARDATRRDAQLKEWRERFAALDHVAANTIAPQLRQAMRLRIGTKKWNIEISPKGPDGAYRTMPVEMLRDMLSNPAESVLTVDDAGNALLNFLRANYRLRNRTTLTAKEPEDRALLGQMLVHPTTRPRIVNSDGRPFVDDPRPLTWQIADHPTDPELATVRLVLPDGSPPPGSLMYVPASPAIYVAEDGSLFKGLPPPREPSKAADADFACEVPRAALALPEAGRFAARTGVKLPGDTAGRFRSEPLRARIRATLEPRHSQYGPREEVLLVELQGIAPDGSPRVLLQETGWNTSAREVVRPADAAFLLHDYASLQPAVDHFGALPGLWWTPNDSGPDRCIREITAPSFPEEFAAWLAAMPDSVIVELGPELRAFAEAPTRARFSLEIEESGIDWFDVRVSLRVEDTTLTPAEITLLRKARGRFIRLAGRGWRRLEISEDKATGERLERLGLEPATLADDTSREAQKFHALQLADEALGEAMPAKLARQIRERAATIRSLPAPAVPAGFHGELRPYQVEGFHFLAHLSANHFGGVLADDMGLGKTLEALVWLLWLSERAAKEGRGLRALVVCPKSVVFNWETETARFAPSLATGRISPRDVRPVPKAPQLIVVNYAQLRLNAGVLAAEKWDAVILDEGQNIKNPTSATARAARALIASHRLVLTGTPVENRLLDLWSLFAFAQPGLLGGQSSFNRLYRDRENPAAAHARLAKRVRHFLLRRTKSQVARDLPERTEEDMIVELDGQQRALYEAELKRTRAMLLKVESARDFDAQRFNILQSLLRLRQICCDPRLLGAELPKDKPSGRKKTAAADPADKPSASSAKLDALLETLEPLVAEGHRVLVFSQFVTMLELIRAELVARDIAHLMLTGQTENRQALVEKFQAADGPPVFLLSLKAAGAGLNLTAASYVVLYDPWWNPAVEAQAIDRTHRIGQKAHVIAYRLLARDTVEEKIRALQKEKAALAAAVVQEESLAKVLDLESLRRILG